MSEEPARKDEKIGDEISEQDSKKTEDISPCRSVKSVNLSVKKNEQLSDDDKSRLLMNFFNIVMNPGRLDSLMKEMGSDEKFTSLMFGNTVKPEAASKSDDRSGRKGCFTRKIFDILDRNGDGFITKSELKISIAPCTSSALADEDIENVFSKLDLKKTGKICYEGETEPTLKIIN